MQETSTIVGNQKIATLLSNILGTDSRLFYYLITSENRTTTITNLTTFHSTTIEKFALEIMSVLETIKKNNYAKKKIRE
jgi:hypothetical protein